MPAFKKLAALALALTMILALAACGAAEAEPDVTSPQGSSSAGSYTVTDIFGREVEIPGEVQSVAALGSAARLLCYMDEFPGKSFSGSRADGIHVSDYQVRHAFPAENRFHIPEIFHQCPVAAYYAVCLAEQISRVFLFRKSPVVYDDGCFHFPVIQA